ncbi:MAG: cupin domain-containing protein [Candidatus Kapaibacteriales bacterium]
MTNEILAKSTKINELIDYQENSIVSKILLNQKEGNATLSAFWSGQELSEHTAPFDALVFGLDGIDIVGIDGQENIVQAGDVIIMPEITRTLSKLVRLWLNPLKKAIKIINCKEEVYGNY